MLFHIWSINTRNLMELLFCFVFLSFFFARCNGVRATKIRLDPSEVGLVEGDQMSTPLEKKVACSPIPNSKSNCWEKTVQNSRFISKTRLINQRIIIDNWLVKEKKTKQQRHCERKRLPVKGKTTQQFKNVYKNITRHKNIDSGGFLICLSFQGEVLSFTWLWGTKPKFSGCDTPLVRKNFVHESITSNSSLFFGHKEKQRLLKMSYPRAVRLRKKGEKKNTIQGKTFRGNLGNHFRANSSMLFHIWRNFLTFSIMLLLGR